MAITAAALRKVGVYDFHSVTATGATVDLPEVFTAPIRPDHIHYLHTQLAKNSRQAYAVKPGAGYQTSAESWGTGRAVARIPRVPGGGTHRAGQAAFGNMCRGGGMFAPTKTYRRWHRRTNHTERRHAVAGALAASAVTSLVEGRGHRISAVPEMPIVVSDAVHVVDKTKQAKAALVKLGLGEELDRCIDGKMLKSGHSQRRNRKYRVPNGPLVVHDCPRDQMKAFHNLPGVEVANIDDLNLLQLAPGGSVGRLVVFSESAFRKLDPMYREKSGYTFQKPLIANADIKKIIASPEIQAVLRPCKATMHTPKQAKRSLLKGLYETVNPAATPKPTKEALKIAKASKRT